MLHFLVVAALKKSDAVRTLGVHCNARAQLKLRRNVAKQRAVPDAGVRFSHFGLHDSQRQLAAWRRFATRLLGARLRY
jgi:hypothetical protein